MPPMPFLFNVYDRPFGLGNRPNYLYTIVKVAYWDLVHYPSFWMDDPQMPKDCVLRPDVDISTEVHEFSSEEEAVNWIREWWKTH